MKTVENAMQAAMYRARWEIFEIRTAHGFPFREFSNRSFRREIYIVERERDTKNKWQKSSLLPLPLSPTTRKRFPRPLSPENPLNSFRGTHNKQRTQWFFLPRKTVKRASLSTNQSSHRARMWIFATKKLRFNLDAWWDSERGFMWPESGLSPFSSNLPELPEL